MHYLFVTDMDGTLLNDKSELTSNTITKIKSITALGHNVILASGRSYLGMIDYYQQLKLSTPIIALNGSVIYYSDGTKDEEFLNKNILYDIYTKLKKYYYILMFNASDNIYSHNHSYELEEIFNGRSGNGFKEINFDKYSLDNVYNVVVVIYSKYEKDFESYFKDLYIKPRLWGSKDGYSYYDLYDTNISKASALNKVLKKLNINKDIVYTFGDGVNDTELVTINNNGVAMINGVTKTKEVAKFITKLDNNNDGVVDFIDKLITNKK